MNIERKTIAGSSLTGSIVSTPPSTPSVKKSQQLQQQPPATKSHVKPQQQQQQHHVQNLHPLHQQNSQQQDSAAFIIAGDNKMLREQDRFLPIANIARIMKRHIPDSGKIAKESKECIQECVSEFISFITSEASERCLNEKRKTINGEDILWAMHTLGFEPYVEPLKVYLTKFRAACKGDKALEELGLVPVIPLDQDHHQQQHHLRHQDQQQICIATANPGQAADLSALFQNAAGCLGQAQGGPTQILLATSADLDHQSMQQQQQHRSQHHVTPTNQGAAIGGVGGHVTFLATPPQHHQHQQQNSTNLSQNNKSMPSIVYLDATGGGGAAIGGFHGGTQNLIGGGQGTPQHHQLQPANQGRPQFITLTNHQTPPSGVQFVQLVPASAAANSTNGGAGATAAPPHQQQQMITLQPASTAAS